MSKNLMNSTGSSSGSPKAIRSGNFPKSQAIAHPSSNVLKITGLNKHRQSNRIIQRSSTSSTTALTSIKTDVLSASWMPKIKESYQISMPIKKALRVSTLGSWVFGQRVLIPDSPLWTGRKPPCSPSERPGRRTVYSVVSTTSSMKGWGGLGPTLKLMPAKNFAIFLEISATLNLSKSETSLLEPIKSGLINTKALSNLCQERL